MAREIVTSENRKEYMEKKLNGIEEKPKFKFPHYNVGDIVKMSHGHMKVTDLDKKAEMYHGHDVNVYGEQSVPKIGRAAMHSDVGTGHHHLYAEAGDYPTRETTDNPSHKDTSK